jgi:hypothetical protein
MDQRLNMAARRRGLWAAAIVTAAPLAPAKPSDTFATNLESDRDPPRPVSWNNSPAIATAQDNAPLIGYTGAGRTTRSFK